MAHPWALRTVGKRQKAKAKVKTQNAKVKTDDDLRGHRREGEEGSALRPETACKTKKSTPRLLALLTLAFCVLTFAFCFCIAYPPSAHCLPPTAFCLLPSVLMRPHMQQPKAVGEEDIHQHNHHDQRRHQGGRHAWPLVAEVHKVSDDQRRLDDREAHQQDEHQLQFQLLVAEKNLHPGERQEPKPDDQEDPRGALSMGVLSRCAHESSNVLSVVRCQLHVVSCP